VNGLTHGIRIVAKKHAGSPDDAGPAGAGSAAPFVPETRSVRTLAAAAQQCRGCDLYKNATQVVFGAGPSTASVMFVGEQPGDQEDRQGEPFVGPAGALLDKALEDAGIPRAHVYVTNAVKHFKWEPRGKRRLHVKPNAAEIHACRPWLDAEIEAVRPEVIVCLGSTAAQVFFGRSFRLTKSRGVLEEGHPWARRILATFHPSAVLRMKGGDDHEYTRARRAFPLDLAGAASLVKFASERALRRPRRRAAAL